MLPQRRVVLLTGNRDAERCPEHVGADADLLGEETPVPLLVDERLADVEENGSQSHDSTSCRSAAVVIFRSRTSPSTTRIRPPPASTSDAQSVASIGLEPRYAARSAAAVNACGVCTVTRPAAVDGLDDEPALDPLHRVGEREDGHDPVDALCERTEHTLDDRVVDERAGGVVDDHDERHHPAPLSVQRAPTRRASPRR